MKYHFFYGGFLSQWYPATFTVAYRKYNCAEQYMMAAKAIRYGDLDAYHAIMASSDPHEQKTLGRCVRGFDAADWNSVARDLVYTGNLRKFEQNKELLKLLQDTAPALLVEASPADRLWGIGLSEDDPKRLDPKNWRGANWLGEVLTAVRDGKPPKWSDTGHVYSEPPPI